MRNLLIPVRCLPARPAARWAGGLVLLALGLGGPLATEESLPRRVGLRCDLLVMGMGGTRQLATRRIVLEPGMAGRVLFSTPAGSAGREDPTSVSLNLATGVTAAGRMSIKLDGTVIAANENFLGIFGYRLDEINRDLHTPSANFIR